MKTNMSGRLLAGAIVALSALLAATPSFAELQNVVVGGELRIRANYWRHLFNDRIRLDAVGPTLRWPASMTYARPIGDAVGGQNVMSFYDWDNDNASYSLIEQRTLLNMRADFTNDISVFMELASYDVWGEDFRSNYVTGLDTRSMPTAFADDVEMYQAYIEVANMFGLPLRARIGRQELVIEDGWLLGNNTALPEFPGLPFDAIRLWYETDLFSVSGFASKLVETSPREEDGDVNLYGLHATYSGFEKLTLGAYWLWLRDARMVNDTNLAWFGEWLENWVGIDDYDVTNLHTLALHGQGQFGRFDLDVHAAYQFGEADRVGALFKPFLYGDNHARFDAWAGDVTLGYTFEAPWKPRVYAGAAYFDGEDNRDITFWEWLFPLRRPDSSVSFNRLFSNRVYSHFIGEMAQMSNIWTARVGVTAQPTDAIELGLEAAYFETIEAFGYPPYVHSGDRRTALFPALTFWTKKSDTDLGWESKLWAKYRYSDDLSFEAGWSHFFTGDGLETGQYSGFNGLISNGGTDDRDADYFYFESLVQF